MTQDASQNGAKLAILDPSWPTQRQLDAILAPTWHQDGPKLAQGHKDLRQGHKDSQPSPDDPAASPYDPATSPYDPA